MTSSCALPCDRARAHTRAQAPPHAALNRDPSFSGKSVAPYLCALLLRLNGQLLHSLQWVCVVIQCCAIAIVQYDACKGTGFLPLKAYYMIGAATLITAITSVWNQLIIKGFEVTIELQRSPSRPHALTPSRPHPHPHRSTYRS